MKKLAIVRGKFLNQYEMQSFAPLVDRYTITAFASLHPFHDTLAFPVVKLPSPMDLSCGAGSRFARPILNRLYVDAHYLYGLEEKLKGFDIVHSAETYYRYTQQALDARNKGYVKKVIATVLENIPFNNEGIWGRRAFKKRSREELDHIIALTNLTKQALLKEGTDPEKITVIGHGVDTKRFCPDKTHWQRLSQTRDSLNILFSGRIEKYKGVMDILDAIPFIRKKTTTPLTFTFIGEGTALSEMKRKEKELGIEQFVKHISVPYERMPEAYQSADIFVAPSSSTKTWREQYCTALLEAQSMGLPIVTTTSGGIPENVGDVAILVSEKNPKALAGALLQFIQSPRLRLRYGKKARKRAQDVHDVRLIADKLDTVYRKVLET